MQRLHLVVCPSSRNTHSLLRRLLLLLCHCGCRRRRLCCRLTGGRVHRPILASLLCDTPFTAALEAQLTQQVLAPLLQAPAARKLRRAVRDREPISGHEIARGERQQDGAALLEARPRLRAVQLRVQARWGHVHRRCTAVVDAAHARVHARRGKRRVGGLRAVVESELIGVELHQHIAHLGCPRRVAEELCGDVLSSLTHV